MKLEERTCPFEIRELTEDGTFEGHAAVFAKADNYDEIIDAKAFNKTLKEGNTRPILWYHDVTRPLGLAEVSLDKKGLLTRGALNLDVQEAREKHSLMKQKAIKGLSFGFRTIRDAWDGATRILKEVKLYEISPCTFQAHPSALITAVKSLNLPTLDAAIERLEEQIQAVEEFKGDALASATHIRSLNDAIKALTDILKKLAPSKDTQAGKSLLLSVIEELETKSTPREHLLGQTIKTLGNHQEV